MRKQKPHKLENTEERLTQVHSKDKCKGEYCTIHNMSDHNMRHLPQHWRGDAGFMERICEHGVGHPDPDEVFQYGDMRSHMCDGCCFNFESETNHDKLCPNFKGSCCPWIKEKCSCQCNCEFIKLIREDERNNIATSQNKPLIIKEHDELCECSAVDECGYDPCVVRTPACVCDCKGIKLGREASKKDKKKKKKDKR